MWEPTMTILACPSCKKPLSVADDKPGVMVACPFCNSHLRVPANGQAAHGNTAARPSVLPASTSPAAPNQATARRTSLPHSASEWNEVDVLLGEAVDVLDRSLTDQEESQVRASLTSYANSIPHHKHQNLGQWVTITKVREFRAYNVVLDSLFEKRHITRKIEPVQGKNIPAAKTTEATIRVWGCPYPPAPDFRKSTKENLIEDSKALQPCQQCGGQKAALCGGCSGSGAVACSECGGGGLVSCLRCSGNGIIQVKTGTQQKWLTCGHCVGTGQNSYTNERCQFCAGRGLLPKDEDVYQAMPCPCGNGRVRCYTCEGQTKLRCSKCSGSGKLTCTSCQGQGQMISYLCVVQTFEPNTQTITAPFSGIKDQTVSGMVQSSDHSPFLTLTTTAYPTNLKLTKGFEKLRAAITQAFDAAYARVSGDNRMVRQRMQVGAASILEIVYQHEGKEYTAWFAGKQFRTYAPVNPVTDELKQMVQDAVEIWKKGDQKEAAVRLLEIEKMAKANPSCQAAYDQVRGTIPSDLEAKARWIRRKPYLIAGAVALGVFLVVACLGMIGAIFRGKDGRDKPNSPPDFKEFKQPGGNPPPFR